MLTVKLQILNLQHLHNLRLYKRTNERTRRRRKTFKIQMFILKNIPESVFVNLSIQHQWHKSHDFFPFPFWFSIQFSLSFHMFLVSFEELSSFHLFHFLITFGEHLIGNWNPSIMLLWMWTLMISINDVFFFYFFVLFLFLSTTQMCVITIHKSNTETIRS